MLCARGRGVGPAAAHMSATDMRSDAAAGVVRLTTLAGAEKAVEDEKKARAMVGDVQLVRLRSESPILTGVLATHAATPSRISEGGVHCCAK